MTSKDPELWAKEWSCVAKPYEAQGIQFEKEGKFQAARKTYIQAYAYYATGRYPTPHTPGKIECYRKSLEVYEKAGKYFAPTLERVEIGSKFGKIPIYVRVPKVGAKHAIVINFGGIDSFKAESYEYDEGLQKAGMASRSVDMPGVGECPIKATPTADSVFSAVLDYLETRPDVDASESRSWAEASAATGRPRWPTSKPNARAHRSSGAVAHTIFLGRLAPRIDQHRKLSDGPRHRPLPLVRCGKIRRPFQTLVFFIAQRPRLARQTILADADRQRQRRSVNAHRRSLHLARIRLPQVSENLRRRPHGPNARDLSDHRQLVEE